MNNYEPKFVVAPIIDHRCWWIIPTICICNEAQSKGLIIAWLCFQVVIGRSLIREL
jgi:hypothetical protein